MKIREYKRSLIQETHILKLLNISYKATGPVVIKSQIMPSREGGNENMFKPSRANDQHDCYAYIW